MARKSLNEIELTGTVLRAYPYGDANLILKILSPTQGKVTLVAKAARQSKRRFSGSFDYFDTGRFRIKVASEGEIYGSVVDFTPVKSFGDLRTDLTRLIAASVVCEAFDLLLLERSHDSAERYDILALSLEAISQSGGDKDALKGCFLGLANLLSQEGFLSAQQLAASAKNLLHLIEVIESHTNLELRTKSSLLGLLNEL